MKPPFLHGVQSWGGALGASHRGPCFVGPTTCRRKELLSGWIARSGWETGMYHPQKSPRSVFSASPAAQGGPGWTGGRHRAGLVGLGKDGIAGLTPNSPKLSLWAVGIVLLKLSCAVPHSSLGVPSGWSPAGSLSLGLEAKPCYLCVSQDLQTDWSLVRLCGAVLASESLWDIPLT